MEQCDAGWFWQVVKIWRVASDDVTIVSMAAVLVAATAQAQGAKPLAKCAEDAVVAGTVCMDKYEASVGRIADPLGTGKSLVKKVKAGKAARDLER